MMNPKLETLLAKYKVNLFELQMIDDQNWILRTDRDMSNTTLKAAIESEFPIKLTLGPLSEAFKQLSLVDAIQGAQPDAVNHPSHYNKGKIEVIEFLEDQQLEPHEWNAVKYVCRARHKGRELEDLKKAIWYLERKIELLKARNEKREPARPNNMGAKKC